MRERKIQVLARHNVIVTVADNGPGLDPAHLEHIFAAFFTTKAEGVGMGLSICNSIVRAQQRSRHWLFSSPRWWSNGVWNWNRWWSHGSTRIPMDTGPANRRSMRSACAAAVLAS